MMESEDPFYDVKGEITSSLNQAQTLFSTVASSAASPNTLSVLTQLLQTLEADIADLEETIKVIEVNPYKYKLDFTEVRNRKYWVEKTRGDIERLKNSVRSIEAAKKNKGDRDALLSTKNSTAPSPYATVDVVQDSNSRFAEREEAQQQMIMQQQDQQLDGVLDTVFNLKGIAHTMGRELEDQAGLLEDLEMGVDNTQGRLGFAQKKMNEVLKAARSDTKSTIAIICLTLLLLVLLVFIIVS